MIGEHLESWALGDRGLETWRLGLDSWRQRSRDLETWIPEIWRQRLGHLELGVSPGHMKTEAWTLVDLKTEAYTLGTKTDSITLGGLDRGWQDSFSGDKVAQMNKCLGGGKPGNLMPCLAVTGGWWDFLFLGRNSMYNLGF